jgi:hypothetical protein
MILILYVVTYLHQVYVSFIISNNAFEETAIINYKLLLREQNLLSPQAPSWRVA